ncbi:MAG: GNAT family N-acetyltransferase [Actinomycetota bacterium]|nr:GNAT family N-acetyltransferase [Actinomycetota bacterium]
MIPGERILLRRVEPADYPLVLQWQNDPEIFRWMDYDRVFSLDDIRRSEEHGAQEGHPFIIEAEGRPIGRTGLFGIKPRTQHGNLYIFVGDRAVQGKGYAREALMLLLMYAFDSLNLRLVQLWTLADNERAIHLYKTLGFVEEARLRARAYHDGHLSDSLIMSITRDEFERTRTQS